MSNLHLTPTEQSYVDRIGRLRDDLKQKDADKPTIRTQIKRLTNILMASYYKDHPDFPSLSRGNQGQG